MTCLQPENPICPAPAGGDPPEERTETQSKTTAMSFDSVVRLTEIGKREMQEGKPQRAQWFESVPAARDAGRAANAEGANGA
jgi:hypothetical protein